MPQQASSLDQIWCDDTLHRRTDAEFLFAFLLSRIAERGQQGRPRSYVLNLNAEWGEGKSFFLSRLKLHAESLGHLVATVNAWKDDHADDPLLSVMAAIDAAVSSNTKLKPKTKKAAKKAFAVGARLVAVGAKGAIHQLGTRYFGREAVEIVKETLGEVGEEVVTRTAKDISKTADEMFDDEAKQLMAKFSSAQRSIEEFRSQLSTFLSSARSERKPPLFVLVDELDRCRPNYAIALLERIKHLFEIDDVIFILATDTRQLSHAVGAVYGSSFDSVSYLRRFFDRTYVYEQPDREEFLVELIKRAPLDESKISLPPSFELVPYLLEGFDYFGLTLRDVEQTYDIIRTVASAWSAHASIEMAALFPLAVGYQRNIPIEYGKTFVDNLRNLSATKGRTIAEDWRANMQYRDPNNFGMQQASMSGLELFDHFAKYAVQPLRDTLNNHVSVGFDGWIWQRIADENTKMDSLRNGRTFSIIRQYPEIVRSAGRLSPRNDAPNE